MSAVRKFTVQLPEKLLQNAQKSTGEGTTATIRKGLELLAARNAYRELRKLRGKVRVNIDVAKLREDR